MRAFRAHVGRKVLVRCQDVTYRGVLQSARGGVLSLTESIAIDRDSRQPIDGVLLVPVDHVLHVQVPTS